MAVQCPPYMTDVDIDRSGLDFDVMGPTFRDQIFTAVYDVGCPHELEQQPELERRQVDDVTISDNANPRDIDLYISAAEYQLGCWSRKGTAG
ncbi:hypothetical protein FQZ97_1043090 [compost metagenome]